MTGPLSPDATSTEGSSSPSSVSSAPSARASAAAPKKKRVRRQQLELKQLRELSEELKRRVEQLKRRRLCTPQTQRSRSNDNLRSSKKAKYGPAPVWEAIADRQFKERSRVEKQNEELKLLLKAQSGMAQSLQAKVLKILGDKCLIGLTMMQLQDEGPRYWDLGSGDEEGIFADLLTLVVRTHLAIQRQQVENPRSVLTFATWGISVGEPHVRADSEAGLVMETHACSLLPFSVATTAAACWRMFSLSPVKHIIVSRDIENVDVFAQSFTCSSTHLGREIDVRGKHTCRRYVEEDGCITIVFAGRTEPTNVSTPCQDAQLQKTGWIKVRELRTQDSDQPPSAMIEMHSETLPRFRYGNTGQVDRAREIMEWVSNSHHMTNDWYRQTLSEVLVEEDWKAFRGGDTDEVAA
ncbi:uncharacterized protein IUM83_18530 [Phytophthora cinnamomi]|uniref:uncharacterized protein n=1 Tax=Phytophthora cinnamomi TaxID=4785 RepID=UPI00355A8E6F|nr:hypothetical protein IUM83_18530 [Phytophthora cinnamomi]